MKMEAKLQITASLMAHILKQDNTPEGVAKLIKKYNDIHTQRFRTLKAKEDARLDYENTLKKLSCSEKEIQHCCDHPVSTYNADPAGGSDSYRECDICGKEY